MGVSIQAEVDLNTWNVEIIMLQFTHVMIIKYSNLTAENVLMLPKLTEATTAHIEEMETTTGLSTVTNTSLVAMDISTCSTVPFQHLCLILRLVNAEIQELYYVDKLMKIMIIMEKNVCIKKMDDMPSVMCTSTLNVNIMFPVIIVVLRIQYLILNTSMC